MSNQFIKINNEFFKGKDENGINTFLKIGTEGFTLYTYFLYQQGINQSCNINIRMIQSFLCRDYEDRPELEYKNKKDTKCKISCIKDRKTILHYIECLYKNKFIVIHNIDDILKGIKSFGGIGINEILIISCNGIPNDKYTIIPNDLYFDYIHKIGHIGWSLLTILSNLHNASFGGEYSYGFAYPKEEYLSEIINKGLTTTKQYLYLLGKQKLIKIEPQPTIIIETSHGDEYIYTRNHYIVKWKIPDNEYYIEKK